MHKCGFKVAVVLHIAVLKGNLYETSLQDLTVYLVSSLSFLSLSLPGFNAGGSGECAIRFRPALIFTLQHANMFLNGLESVLKEYF